jgi:hypothetical protein
MNMQSVSRSATAGRGSRRVGVLALMVVALAMGAAATPSARADISFLDSFRNLTYAQTANSGATFNGAFYSADLNTSIPNSYTSVTMTYPGPGSPLNIPQVSPTDYHYQTSLFATEAAMNTAFPTGTYTFQGVNGPTTDTANFLYAADDYSQSTPYLTGNDYSSLQGMNASQAFTFHFSPFVTGSTANFSYIFFTIYDETTSTTAFNEGFLAPTTTSVTVPANTLTPGHLYDYEVDYSNRDTVTGTGATFAPQLGFDTRTDGLFSTAAVPEPSSLVLLSFGVGIGTAVMLRRRARTSRAGRSG